MNGRLAIVVCIILSSTTAAFAHPLAPALLELTESAPHTVSVRWKTSLWKQAGVALEPILPPTCVALTQPHVSVDASSTTATWTADCGGAGLVGTSVGISGLARSETDTLLHVVLADGRSIDAVLRGDNATFTIPSRPSRARVLYQYADLGMRHILGGFDHLLFVFGLLLLVPTRRELIRTVTAFTAGHSLTLSLAALGYATLPSAPIELLIALTILALAIELARPPRPHPSMMRRRPWMMAFVFGLLHGLGFAGALREVGLPAGEIPTALFAFNGGIEVGQLLFVAAVLILKRIVSSRVVAWPADVARAPIYAMGTLAAFWSFERAAAWLG